jgi:hypothetical protein
VRSPLSIFARSGDRFLQRDIESVQAQARHRHV